MDFYVVFMIAVPITTFCPGNSCTIYYGDFCFGVLEVCHIVFLVYHVQSGTRICYKCFSVMVFSWSFHNKQFVIDYVFCDIISRLFPDFSSFRNPFLLNCSYCNNFISFYYLSYCCSFIFLPWFYFGSLSWHIRFCYSNSILVCSHFLYARSSLTLFPYFLQVMQVSLYWDLT